MREREATPRIREGYVEVTGGKVWYRIVGAENTKPPLLTLHGGPGGVHGTMAPLEDLSDERQVIFYDQLGSGKSDKPADRSLWKLERFVSEVEQVRQGLGLDTFHLQGQSWGSLLATEYALSHPGAVKSLVLSGPFLSVPRWLADTNRLKEQLPEHTQKAIDKHESQGTTDSEEYKSASEEYFKRYVCRIEPLPEWYIKGREGFSEEVYEIMWGPSEFTCTGELKGYDATGKLHLIKVPVQLVCGQYDEATPETAQYYASLFQNAKVHVFENCSHLVYVEQPKNYVRIIRQFLRAVDDLAAAQNQIGYELI